MPKVARNGLIALPALTDNCRLDAIRNAERRFVEENLQCFRSLVSGVGARQSNTQRIKRGVGAGRICVRGYVNTNPFSGPVGLIDFREAMGEIQTVAPDERSDRGNPTAICFVMFV